MTQNPDWPCFSADMWDSSEAWGSTPAQRGQDWSHNEHNTNPLFIRLYLYWKHMRETLHTNLLNNSVTTDWLINRISSQMHKHIQKGKPKRGAPLWNRTFWNCQEKTLYEPASRSSLIKWFRFYDQEKVILLCSRKNKKIKLRLCGKSIRWSSKDFQLRVITNLWPLEKEAQRSCSNKTAASYKKKVCVLSNRRKFSVREKREV